MKNLQPIIPYEAQYYKQIPRTITIYRFLKRYIFFSNGSCKQGMEEERGHRWLRWQRGRFGGSKQAMLEAVCTVKCYIAAIVR